MADPPKSPKSEKDGSADANGVTAPGSPKSGTSPPTVRNPQKERLLERQASRDSARGVPRLRTISSGTSLTGRVRTESMGSGRRPSLSLGHADAIPWSLEKPDPDEIDPEEVPWWTSRRLLLSLICFVGFFFLYSLRVNISTAIVCMNKYEDSESEEFTNNASLYFNISSNSTDVYSFNITTTLPTSPPTSGDECPVVQRSSTMKAEFTWDKKLQGFILGAFFWGYTVMQIPSGYLSDVFGPRLMISIGMFPVAILTIICPFLARGSPYLLLVGRVLIGCGEAMMYPGMQSLWAKWSPPHERSRLVGFAFGGSQLGNALTFPLAGLLCAYGFDGGWPSVFYVTGAAALCWCFLYAVFVRDSPGQMAGIKPIERKYIEKSLGVYGQSVEQGLKNRKQKKPWKKIFTSGPVWAILIANSCGNYGAYMLLTQMPTYMKEVLKFDIKSNGAYSMLPYLVFWLFIIGGGQIADQIISRNILSIEWTRKLCCAIGMVIPAIFLVLTGYMDCHHQIEAVVLLSLSMGFCGFQFSSFFINHGDIAPRYAGTVFGFTNTGASVPGILAPYIVGAITSHKTREEWLVAFYIAAAVYVAGAILYAILAKGEVQDWAKEEQDDEDPGPEIVPLQEIQEEVSEEDEEKRNDKKPLDGGPVKFE